LEVGRVYEVVGLRDKVFSCKLHEDGVRVVEVVESNIPAAIPSRKAFEGAVITFYSQKCEFSLCEYSELCEPAGIYDGDRCKILEVGEKIKCKCGLSLVKVSLSRSSGA